MTAWLKNTHLKQRRVNERKKNIMRLETLQPLPVVFVAVVVFLLVPLHYVYTGLLYGKRYHKVLWWESLRGWVFAGGCCWLLEPFISFCLSKRTRCLLTVCRRISVRSFQGGQARWYRQDWQPLVLGESIIHVHLTTWPHQSEIAVNYYKDWSLCEFYWSLAQTM